MRKLDRRLVALLRIGLGVLFVVAAWPKLTDPHAFATSIANYRLLPESVERVLALVLAPLELIVGLALIFGVLDAGASALALAMLVIFTAAIAAALARGLDITCGCFESHGGEKVGARKIAENVAFLAAAVAVAFGDRSWLSVSGWLQRSGDIE